jgi:hypothetical protein
MVNLEGIEEGEFINNALRRYTPTELIELANKYSASHSS